MSESPKIKKEIKKEPQKQKRFFISSLNTSLGQELVETLRNDHINDENPHFIVGSLSKKQNNNPIPRGVFRVIDTTKVAFLSKVLLDSDVIIYDLNTCDLEEAEFAIKTFKMGEYKDEKILIFISSVMVWSNTPPKEKKEGEEAQGEGEEEEGLEEPPSEEDENAQQPPEGEEEVQKKTYLRYTEKDYTLRNPLPKYEILKSLETMCISAGNTKPNLKTFVLCAGIQYGNGEDVFYERYFKQAWLQNPKELLVFGDGKNRIPAIHVRDLATFAKKLTEKQPNQSYIFAIDHNQKPTQLSLVKSISKGLGTGLVKNIDLEQAALQYENFDIFTLNVRLRPTKVFDQFLSQEEEEENQEEGEEGEVKKEKFKFDWHCKEGIPASIQKLTKEFNDYRELKPNKILLCGPPASGKTYLGEQLSKYYNIPHILISQVIEDIKNIPNELQEEIKQYCEEQKEALVEKAQQEFDNEKKKRKTKKGEPEPVFDPSKIIVRLTEEQLIKAYKWRLQQTDCLNRGYVLDGYPKTFLQAKGIFLKNKPSDDGENVDDENAEKIVDENLMPQSVIFFDANDDFLKQRVKELPEEKISNTHYTEEGMNRRIAQFRKDNMPQTGNPILIDFFKENNIECLQVNVSNKTNPVFDNLRSYIERNGVFNNYMVHQKEEEIQRVKQLEEQLRLQKEKELEEERIRNQKEEESRKLQEEEYNIKMEKIKQTEKDKLDEKSFYLRQYLADNVVPFLTEGLIELCKSKPDDPVDTLSQYLFKRSLEVQFPDPSQYKQY